MTEIQRLLSETIDDLNVRENAITGRVLVSSVLSASILGLFIAMYAARFATLAVMLQSETLVGSVAVSGVIYRISRLLLFDIAPR